MTLDLSLSQAMESFMLNCRAEGRSPKTIIGYRDVLNRFIALIGDVPARSLTPDNLRTYMASLINRPGKATGTDFSSSSMMKHYQVLRTWTRWMHNQDMIPVCITDKTKAPRIGSRLPSTLSDAEVQALFQLLKTEPGRYRDTVIFTLFLDTGMRLKEVSDLRISDIDLKESWIHIASGKGDKEAMVPMGNRCAREMYNYIHGYRKAVGGEDHVFIGKSGYALGYEGLAVMIKRTISAIRVGKGKHGPHVLRHTMATNFLRAGGSIETLRRLLRHTDIKVTQLYSHLANADILEEHRALSPLDYVYRSQGHGRK